MCECMCVCASTTHTHTQTTATWQEEGERQTDSKSDRQTQCRGGAVRERERERDGGRRGGVSSDMAVMEEGTSLPLSSNTSTTTRSTSVVYVKLTDSALNSLEEFARKKVEQVKSFLGTKLSLFFQF